MPSLNHEVARALRELAGLIELEEGGPQSFRARAYHNAVRSLENLDTDLASLSREELVGIKGVGPSIARKIGEFLETGRIAKLEELRARYPPGFRELSRIPGLGPKTLSLLRRELGVETLEDLQAAIADHRLREVKGLGAKTEENLARAIERLGFADKERRVPIADALPVAEHVVEVLERMREVERIAFAGSLRRFRDTVGDVDVVVGSKAPGPVMDRFCSLAMVAKVGPRGETKCSIVTSAGLQVDLRVVEPAQFGAALLYFTGSKAHNIRLRQLALQRGWTLNEYGLFEEGGPRLASRSEEEVYKALGLDFLPPTLREDTGEIEAALEGRLPRLVERQDLRGDLHDHSDLSGDGHMALERLVEEAVRRDHRYLAVTDHAEGLPVNGANREQMLGQRRQIEELRERHPGIRLLHGAELNIGPAGELDYDEDFLAGYDWCVASIHSHFDLDAERQTRRLVAAIRHPSVNVIGHPTGRRIGRRPGVEFDEETVLEAAAESRTALEINSDLQRLDAPPELARRGAERGVLFVISSDAHVVRELDNLRFGVLNAQRGWVEADMVANTWEPDRFLAWVGERRGA